MLKKNHTACRQTHTPRVGARKTRKFNIILVYCIAVSYESRSEVRPSIPGVMNISGENTDFLLAAPGETLAAIGRFPAGREVPVVTARHHSFTQHPDFLKKS